MVDIQKMKIYSEGFDPSEYKTSKPNLLTNKSVIEETTKVFNAVNSAICHTIGQYGRDTLIQGYFEDENPLYPTRDGYTILDNLNFTQAIPNAFLSIIKDISKYMQTNVGDSTSSGNPIASALYDNLISLYTNEDNKGGEGWKFSPIGINNITRLVAQTVVEGITDNPDYQIKFSDMTNDDDKIELLTRLGTISGNNNYNIGKFVAELYRDKLDGNGSVQVLTGDSEQEETTVVHSDSFEIGTGLVDFNAMVNTVSRTSCELENPNIVVFDHFLGENDIPAINRIIKASCFDMDRPLVFVTESYARKVLTHILSAIAGEVFDENGNVMTDDQYVMTARPKKLPIACVPLSSKATSVGIYDYDDLLIMCDAIPFTSETGIQFPEGITDEELVNLLSERFGTCKRFVGGYAGSSFHECIPNEEARKARIADLERELKAQLTVKSHPNDHLITNLRFRIHRLQNKTDIIYVGGSNNKNKYGDKLIYDDVVSAIDSAIKHDGVSIGGNISVSHYIHNNLDDITNKVKIKINEAGYNITAGTTNNEELTKIINDIANVVGDSFGQAYRYALFNMYQDSTRSYSRWTDLISRMTPSIYNTNTGKVEKFIPFDNNGRIIMNDSETFTTVLVPRNTDKCLLTIVTETVAILLKLANMLTVVPPDMDLDKIRKDQMSFGSSPRGGVPM